MQSSTRTRHIDQVISAVSSTQNTGTFGQPDLIRKSWARCVNDHGLDPTVSQPARILGYAELREHQEQVESFMRVARGGMEQMFSRLSPLGYALFLLDAKGIVVDYIGNDEWDLELKRAGLSLGADWSELHAGTCGAGTSIYEMEALTCHHEDHFNAAHIDLTCTATPLFDPTGEFMGILNASALKSPEMKESQLPILHLTTMYAKMVEDANFLRYFHNYWILRLGADWAMVNVSGELMLAFDRDGVIIGANRAARKSLVAISEGILQSNLIGQNLTAVFKTPLDKVWRLSRAGTTSDRSVLSTVTHEPYFAMVIPPYVTANSGARTTLEPETDCSALDKLAGEDPQMKRLTEQAKRLVNKHVNILLHGETGTGKELIACALHDSSNRRNNPFVAINCAAIPESLIESELFGYVAGSFTGGRAKGMRGLIQQSDRGTLFLDEVGDMPLHLQSRLLRVLSEQEVMPVGGEKPIPVDLIVVAASHHDLRRLIADGVFREDLYYRLCGATLRLPPLRERCDKRHIISRILEQEGAQTGLDTVISEKAMARLEAFHWPGNIRQLRNVIRFALAICEDGIIDVDHLPQELDVVSQEMTLTPAPEKLQFVASEIDADPLPQIESEASRLLAVLRKYQWNITAVSNELGICRKTVYRQMKRFSIVHPTECQ